MSSFSSSRLKKSFVSSQNQSTALNLSDKITECWLRQNHSQYQQLLIETKQLQLSLLEQESKNKLLLRSFKKKNSQICELQNKLNQLNMENTGKKNYLISYYQHLNDKIKSQSSSVNLFAKLDSLAKSLQGKLQGQRAALDQYVIKIKGQIGRLEEQFNSLQNKRDNLKNNLQTMIETKQQEKLEEYKKKSEQQKQKLQAKQKYEAILSQIQKLVMQKQHLQSSENILKKLLNIEEIHKKHWMMIQKSIKAEFTKRVTESHYKQALAMQYKLKANEMESLVNQRKQEISVLKKQLMQGKRKQQRAKKQLEDNKSKFADVENQMKQQNPRSSAH